MNYFMIQIQQQKKIDLPFSLSQCDNCMSQDCLGHVSSFKRYDQLVIGTEGQAHLGTGQQTDFMYDDVAKRSMKSY